VLDKEESIKAREAGKSEEVSALTESNKELEEQVAKLKGRVVEMNELLSGSDEIAVELQFLKKAVSGVSFVATNATNSHHPFCSMAVIEQIE
jgi:uncharacterized protein involved in exopolysaccharide biosynthesis